MPTPAHPRPSRWPQSHEKRVCFSRLHTRQLSEWRGQQQVWSKSLIFEIKSHYPPLQRLSFQSNHRKSVRGRGVVMVVVCGGRRSCKTVYCCILSLESPVGGSRVLENGPTSQRFNENSLAVRRRFGWGFRASQVVVCEAGFIYQVAAREGNV